MTTEPVWCHREWRQVVAVSPLELRRHCGSRMTAQRTEGWPASPVNAWCLMAVLAQLGPARTDACAGALASRAERQETESVPVVLGVLRAVP